jgi:hypothetical protein
MLLTKTRGTNNQGKYGGLLFRQHKLNAQPHYKQP